MKNSEASEHKCGLNSLRIFSGSTHLDLAEDIAHYLNTCLSKVEIQISSYSESKIKFIDSVRDKSVYIIHSNITTVNHNLMDLLLMIQACKLSSAAKVTPVLTYFPYSKQDKKDKSRSPIAAKLVATLLESSGANHVITMDLHSAQIQGFFNIPIDNLYSEPSILEYIKQKIPDYQNTVIVSPDAGGVKKVTSIATILGLNFAIINRDKKKVTDIESMKIIGDVKDKDVILIDDIADTGKTLDIAAKRLQLSKAKKIYAIVFHGILCKNGCQLINDSPIERLVVTNSLPQDLNKEKCKKLDVIDMSRVFGEAIKRSHNGKSLSYLFTHIP